MKIAIHFCATKIVGVPKFAAHLFHTCALRRCTNMASFWIPKQATMDSHNYILISQFLNAHTCIYERGHGT